MPATALEHAPSCNDAVRAIGILMAITGNLDRPGGNIFPGRDGASIPKPVDLKERCTQELVDKLVAPEFPRPFQPMAEGTVLGLLRHSGERADRKNPIPFAPSLLPAPSPRSARAAPSRV